MRMARTRHYWDLVCDSGRYPFSSRRSSKQLTADVMTKKAAADTAAELSRVITKIVDQRIRDHEERLHRQTEQDSRERSDA